MNIKDLKTEPRIVQWLESVNGSTNTERGYLYGIQIYTDWCGKTPSELIIEARKEEKELDMIDRSIKRVLPTFRKVLQDRGLSQHTVKGYMTAVQSFYTYAEIQLPKMNRRSAKVSAKSEHMDVPSKEDLQDVLKVADPLEKSLLLVGVSSGLAMNEISNLRVKDFKKGYDPKTGITTLKLRRQKVNFDFITFLSPEASKSCLDYLEYRNRGVQAKFPSRQKQLEKQKVFSDDGYLFIQRRFSDDWYETHDEGLRKLDRASFGKLYQLLAEKSQKTTAKGVYGKIRSHNLRKYFNSTLLNAGCDSFVCEFFMGHTLDSTRVAYFRASPEKLRDIYARFIPYLTVTPEQDISESAEFQKLKEENQIFATETARHVVERKELQDLKAQITEMEEKRKKEMQNLGIFLEKLISGDAEAIASFEFAKNLRKEKSE